MERVLPHKDMMVQPYLASVESHGERSILFLGGEHTHAIKRPPALSGNPGYDATAAESAPSSEDERAFARQVLAATGFELLYARVDVARDEHGALRLLTEPNLFLRQGGPRAVERLADALAHKARAK